MRLGNYTGCNFALGQPSHFRIGDVIVGHWNFDGFFQETPLLRTSSATTVATSEGIPQSLTYLLARPVQRQKANKCCMSAALSFGGIAGGAQSLRTFPRLMAVGMNLGMEATAAINSARFSRFQISRYSR